MTVDQAKADIVNILDRQTIKRVRRECERLAAERDLPQFAEFLAEENHFILTDKRAQILQGIQQELAAEENPGAILHGAYGSGKTVMMENIALLCKSNEEFGGQEFEQLQYGDTPLDCITISLERNDTPTDFLASTYEALVEHSDSISREDLRAIFNDRKRDELTIEDLDDSLPPRQREHLIDLFEDPDTLQNIATVSKSLTAGEAHKPIVWFTSYYHQQEGRYPAIYIDEFEQLFRQGVDPGSTHRLEKIIQRMIRYSVSGHEDFDTPPYILFANTVSLDIFKDRYAERDLADRIVESVSYNIDLTKEETKELFAKLYRLYVIPLLADRDGEAQAWYDTISSADFGQEGYVHPFTDETLDFALRIAQEFDYEDLDETVVRAFRDYKRILVAFLNRWDGKEHIDLDFLYQHGDAVREELRGQVERVNLDELPGQDSIDDTIEADYPNTSDFDTRILRQLAKVGILKKESRPVYFTADEIVDIAGMDELQISEDEAQGLIDRAADGPEYFEREDDRLKFEPDKLTGTAVGGGELSLAEQVNETVDEHNLDEQSPIALWADMLEEQYDTDFENHQDQYLVFDTSGDINYISKVYLTVAEDELPEQLQTETDDEALHIRIRLGRDPEGDLPAKFHVSERNGRASEITADIQDSLNRELAPHFEEDSGYRNLLDAIQEQFNARYDEDDQYILFIKLSLLCRAGTDVPEDIRIRLADRTAFSVIQKVDNGVTNVDDKYPRKKLGFNSFYTGQNYLNLVYGIKHLDLEDELIFDNPHHPRIDVQSFGRVSRTREAGEEFQSIVSTFAENEPFIEERDNGEYDPVPSLSSFSPVLDTIEAELDDDGLDFDEIIELIFGTTEVENVTKAMVYLLLILGEYWDDYSWVFEDENEETIIPADVRIETKRDQTRSKIGRAIKIEILEQAKQDDPETDPIHDLKDKYDSVDDADAVELDELQDEVDAEWDFDYQTVDEALREIIANDVFADTDIASYANTIRPLDSIDAELRYLILDDLDHLVTQVKEATTILEKQVELNQLIEKMEWFDIEPDLQSEGLEIECLTTIEEFWESSQVERNLEDADVASDLEQYLDGDIQIDRLLEMLQRERKSLVPQVDAYDNTDDKEALDDDIQYATDEIEDAIEDEKEDVEDARDELEDYRDRIPGESSWVRRGGTYLDNCETALDTTPARFDPDEYEDHWDQWEPARSNLEQEAFDEEEFEDTVRKYDDDIEIEDVEDASEDGIDGKFTDLEEDTFRQVITGLDSDSDTAEELKQSLLKMRVKAELTETESS